MLYSLIIGALAGWIASNIMNVSGGLLQNIVIGIIGSFVGSFVFNAIGFYAHRSEERRVGKECRSRWSPYH